MNSLAAFVFVAAFAYASAQCGGELKGPNGTFTSPNWPANYPDGALCSWTITVADGNNIELEFLDFELERASPIYGCLGRDFVTINDGDTVYGPYCGTDMPSKIKSKTNKLDITFRTDESLNYRGFLAQYQEIQNGPTTTPVPPTTVPTTKLPPTTNCGGQFSGESGTFTSPKYPESYPNNADCSFFIDLGVNNTGAITLTFNDFELEKSDNCKADSLTVHNGENGYAPVLKTLCDKTMPEPITGNASSIYLRFKSDAANNFRGFNITWSKATCEELGGSCNATCPNGEFDTDMVSCVEGLKCCKPASPPPSQPDCGKRFITRSLPYIVGGREAKPNSWPWQMSLQRGTFHYCGAVLLSETWVVTAAHCVHDEAIVTVVGGEHDRQLPTGTRIVASDIIVHEDFINSSPWPNDIALLKLSEPFKLNDKIFPACFPQTEDMEFGPEDNCYITGWGDTKGTGDRTVLNELKIPPLPNEVCRLSWGSNILDTNICVGDGTSGSCQGDSGGPLVCEKDGGKWFLGGVTSWGIRGCRRAGYPSVYTRVSKFKSWVDQKVKENGGW